MCGCANRTRASRQDAVSRDAKKAAPTCSMAQADLENLMALNLMDHEMVLVRSQLNVLPKCVYEPQIRVIQQKYQDLLRSETV